MSERVIPEMLSGEEIIDAVCYKVRQKLLRDCFLNASSAYESFEGKITIHLRMSDLGRYPAVDVEVPVKLGEPVKEGAPVVEAEFEIEKEPPNVVRRDTEQGVPALVETGDGKKEIRHLRYSAKK